MSFELDKRLQSDSVHIATLGICDLRLSTDSRYPWLILVPQIANVSELIDLAHEQQLAVLAASNQTSKLLQQCFSPHKLNVACIGNIVKQLHIHHVARFEYDEAWPQPIWGLGERVDYSENALAEIVTMLRDNLP